MVHVAELSAVLAAVGGAARPRFKQWRVFLFEQLLIMAEEVGLAGGAGGAPDGGGGRRANPSAAGATIYIYKASVKVNKIQLVEWFDPAACLGSPDLHGANRNSDSVGTSAPPSRARCVYSTVQ